MTYNCFTYGSLMCEDIMAAVCGVPMGSLRFQPARLNGHARHPVHSEHYPGMVPYPEGSVEGIVYLDIGDPAFLRLDAFEGEMYERQSVLLETLDGHHLSAETYLFRPEYRSLLLSEDWDFETFLAFGKADFLRRYGGFSEL